MADYPPVPIQNICSGSSGLAAESFSVFMNSAQTLGTSAGTRVPFDARNFDVNSRVDITTNKGRYTPQVPGYYRLQVDGLFINTALTAGQFNSVQINKNGSQLVFGNTIFGPVSGGANGSLVVGATAQANGTTDFFEALVSWTGPASLTTFTGTTNGTFSGWLIGKS